MNKFKKILQKRCMKNVIIILSFIIISYLCVSLIIKNNSVPLIGDAQFHWQRINELYDNIIHGNILPNLANKYFSSDGSGVMTLYPYVTLIPFSLLLYFIKMPIYFFNTFFFLCFLLTMIISYYVSYGFNKNRKISYTFAIIYSVLSNNLFWQNDVGMQLAIVFLPISIFGFLSFLKYNKWLEMSIGVSLLLLSHVISALIVPFILLIWLIFNYKYINKLRIINLFKAIITTLLCTSIYWGPAIKLILSNKLVQPLNMFGYGVSGNNIFLDSMLPSSYISDQNYVSFTMNIIALFTIFIGIIYFKKFNNMNKQIYIVSVVTFLMYSNIFPWAIFSNTFFKIIQSPCRIYIVPQLLLNYLFAVWLIKYFDLKNNTYLNITLVLIFSICFQFLIQDQHIKQNSLSNNHTIINDKSLNSKVYTKMGKNDYYPVQSTTDSVDSYIYNNLNTQINGTKFKNIGHGNFEFSGHKNGSIVLPYLYYKGINYNISVNGKYAKVSYDKNHLLKINNLSYNSGNIKINNNIGKTKIISVFAFLTSLIIYFVCYIFKFREDKFKY